MSKKIMFEFVNWTDIFLEHYIFSIIISFLIIILTMFIAKFYDAKNIISTSSEPEHSFENSLKEMPGEEQPIGIPSLRNHPSVAAEKVIESNMTDEQRQQEYEVRQKQLSQIYELMQKQAEKFGEISLSEIQEQFKLYQPVK